MFPRARSTSRGGSRLADVTTGFRARQRKRDVVFYTPHLGAIFGTTGAPSPGGAETQVLALARALARRGVDVALIVFGRADDLPRQIDGIEIIDRPARRRRGAAGLPTEAIAIWQALWRARANTVVYRGVGFELGLLAAYTRLARQRLVFSSASVVDFDSGRLSAGTGARIMFEFGVRLADRIVVQTEDQLPLCKSAFGRVPVLIKSIAPPATPRSGRPESFLWVGRFVSYKRPLDYVTLARSMPDAQFWMVGLPPGRDDERPLAELVVAQAREVANLELLAPRPHDEIQELMKRAVASVNTSDFEGMPNGLLEGWACGVPALVLRHDPGGVVVRHELGGFAGGSMPEMVKLAEVEWARRSDSVGRARMAKRCRAYVAQHHSPEAVAEQWAALLGTPDTPRSSRADSRAGVVCAG
jgi:glycosyltransferase involved in cell wall biosynthesis